MSAPKKTTLTPDEFITAHRMKDRGMSDRYIGAHFGISPSRLRSIMITRARRNKAKSSVRRGRPKIYVENDWAANRHPAFDPARDGEPRYRTEFCALMGDPPIGRSALDALGLAPRDPKEDRSSFEDRPFGIGP